MPCNPYTSNRLLRTCRIIEALIQRSYLKGAIGLISERSCGVGPKLKSAQPIQHKNRKSLGDVLEVQNVLKAHSSSLSFVKTWICYSPNGLCEHLLS